MLSYLQRAKIVSENFKEQRFLVAILLAEIGIKWQMIFWLASEIHSVLAHFHITFHLTI